MNGTGDWLRHIEGVAAVEPAVSAQVKRLHQHLPSQIGEAVFITVVDDEPSAVRGVDQGAVSLAPPAFLVRPGMDQWIVRCILPRAVDALRPGLYHHVARRGTGCTAFGAQIVIVASDPPQFRPFQRIAIRDPSFRNRPAAIDDFFRSWDDRQAVVRKTGPLTAAHEQPPAAVLADHVGRIDVADMEVDRIAPRTIRTFRPNHIVGTRPGRHGEIDVVCIPILADVGGPYAAEVCFQTIADGFPVHQVPAVPYGKSGLILHAGMGHIVVLPVAYDRRIGMVAGQDGIREGLRVNTRQRERRPKESDNKELFHMPDRGINTFRRK